MRFLKKNGEQAIDRVLGQIRAERADEATVEAAARRVRERLPLGAAPAGGDPARAETASRIVVGCAGFRELIPARLDGTLSAARGLLLDDHLRDCPACRRAIAAAREGAGVGTVPAGAPGARPARRGMARWALAAAALAGLAIVGLSVRSLLGPGFPAGPALVETVDGTLLVIPDGTGPDGAFAWPEPLQAGATVPEGREIRTARGSGAVVRLADGSRVEMRERSGLSLSRGRQGATLTLARGSIIVEAAGQGAGRLAVTTGEAQVSVTGTIFSVNSSTKGSRVSVLEGEVRVAHGADRLVLRPGEEFVSHPSLAAVPIESDFSWSRDGARHLALLSELRALGRELDEAIEPPAPRYSTRLLDSLPAGTLVYAAVPNVAASLDEAHRIIGRRIEQSAILAEWWRDRTAAGRADGQGPDADARIAEVIGKVRAFGDHLGEEIILTLQADEAGEFRGMLLVAELTHPGAFTAFLDAEVARLNAASGEGPRLVIVKGSAAAPAGAPEGGALYLRIIGDVFAAATHPGLLATEAEGLAGPGGGGFAGSAFHGRLAQAYRDGAVWLFGADMRRALHRALQAKDPGAPDARARESMRRAGLLDLQDAVIEIRQERGRTRTRAAVTFERERRGIFSWLASPAPMGALDFVSPDASVLAAFAVKEPVLMVEDLLSLLEAADPEAGARLAEFEREEGLRLREDIAAPLGGEIAFAVDGPLLPVPAWKVVLEVYDPGRLQATIERLVGKIREDGGDLRLDSGLVSGRTVHVLTSPSSPVAVHYAFADGYLIAAPQPALIERALLHRSSGVTLANSARFRDLMPRDAQSDFSAVFYQNLGDLLASAARGLAPGGRSPASLPGGAPPTLATLTAREDRIVLSSDSEVSFGALLGRVLGFGEEAGLQGLLEELTREAPEE